MAFVTSADVRVFKRGSSASRPGLYRVLSEGICELKIDFGPGYRIYYVQRGRAMIVLLAGGEKSTQRKDIVRAIALAKNL